MFNHFGGLTEVVGERVGGVYGQVEVAAGDQLESPVLEV
jgi:hypothetical protein